MRLMALAAALVVTALAVPSFAATEARSFRDWWAVCDNTNTCAAFGKGEQGGGWVRIARGAGPDGALEVHVNVWWGGDAVSASIDGRPIVATLDPQTGTATADAPLSAARAMARGSTMTGSAGDQTLEISLSGATAALLWIDERQGRLDTPTAFVRIGDRPVASVPPAPEPPILHAAPPADQSGLGDSPPLPDALKALAPVAECREEMAWNEDLMNEVIAARLNPRTVLWGVPCFAGAYNLGYRFWTTSGDDAPQPVRFPQAVAEPTEELINPTYDPATRILSAFAKGRGLGDCGVAQDWVWTVDGFRLARETEMPDCFGVPYDMWPVVWRAEVL